MQHVVAPQASTQQTCATMECLLLLYFSSTSRGAHLQPIDANNSSGQRIRAREPMYSIYCLLHYAALAFRTADCTEPNKHNPWAHAVSHKLDASTHPPIRSSTHTPTHPSIHPSITHPRIHQPTYPSTYPSTHPFIHHPSIFVPLHLSLYPPTHPSMRSPTPLPTNSEPSHRSISSNQTKTPSPISTTHCPPHPPPSPSLLPPHPPHQYLHYPKRS